MDKAHFVKLLQKYLRGNASKAEQQFLLSYYELFDGEPDVRDLLSEEQKESLKKQINDSIWHSILQHEQQNRKIIPLDRGWMIRIMGAAALVVGVSVSGIWWVNNKTHEPEQPSRIFQTTQKEEHRLIRLPDGSLVISKKGSKLEYPSSFDGLATREVHLEGQAYFDVKHNSSKPFIVHAGNIKTTVLGTSFNIKAWPAEVDISITVTKGKVKVEDQNKIFGTVVQDQQLTFIKERAAVFQIAVDAKAQLGWKEQDLFVDDVTISEAAELLEERFEVEIVCAPEVIRPERFTLTILKGESLEQVLKSICEFNNAVYQMDKEKPSVIISRKR